MKHSFIFDSRVVIGAELPEASQDDIKSEPMLFRCNGEHAMEMGGELTRRFLGALPEDWKQSALLIDSRSHMLMPGWYPCIPGWHHDDVPRERADGQPEYSNPSYRSEHIMALWGDASLTEFAVGKSAFEDVPMGGVYYRQWNPVIELRIASRDLQRITAPERRLLHFDWKTWHQGTAATKNGWRFFIRATRNNPDKPKNELRRQSQIYMSAALAGW